MQNLISTVVSGVIEVETSYCTELKEYTTTQRTSKNRICRFLITMSRKMRVSERDRYRAVVGKASGGICQLLILAWERK